MRFINTHPTLLHIQYGVFYFRVESAIYIVSPEIHNYYNIRHIILYVSLVGKLQTLNSGCIPE